MNSNLPPDYIEPREHYQECEDQPEGNECICLEIEERKIEDEANDQEGNFELGL